LVRNLVVDPHRELVRPSDDLRRGCIGAVSERAPWQVRQRVLIQYGQNRRTHWHRQRIAGIGLGINPLPLGHSGHREHLRRPQHLPKPLVLAKIKGSVAPVIEVRNHDWTAIGKSKFVSRKWRNAPLPGRIFVIKIIARIEGGIAHELKKTAMYLVHSRLRHHVRKACGPVSDLCWHQTRTGLYFLNRIHIEIGKRRPTHFGIGRIEAIHGKNSGRAPLAVYRKLLGEIGGAVRVGHRACRQQQQFAEVTRVQRQTGNFSAGKMLAPASLRRCLSAGGGDAQFLPDGRRLECHGQVSVFDQQRRPSLPFLVGEFHRNFVATFGDFRKSESAIRRGGRGVVAPSSCRVQFDDGSRHRLARSVAQRTVPRCSRNGAGNRSPEQEGTGAKLAKSI